MGPRLGICGARRHPEGQWQRAEVQKKSAEVGEDDLGAREARSPRGLRRCKGKARAGRLGRRRSEGRARRGGRATGSNPDRRGEREQGKQTLQHQGTPLGGRVAPAFRHEVGVAGVTAFGDLPSLRNVGSAPREWIAGHHCIALSAAAGPKGVTAVRERCPSPCRSRGFEGATLSPSTSSSSLRLEELASWVESAVPLGCQSGPNEDPCGPTRSNFPARWSRCPARRCPARRCESWKARSPSPPSSRLC